MELMFNARVLRDLARTHRDQYRTNAPFPHIVIDNFLPMQVAANLPDAFPAPGTGRWMRYDAEDEVKLQISAESAMDSLVREALYQLNSSTFVEFLEELTGIEGLVADPHLEGGGLHQIEPGGFLNVHADFNYHPR